MKRFTLVFLLIITLFNQTLSNQPLLNLPQMTQGAGESVATAFTAPFNTTQTGLLNNKDDIDWFNYTVSRDYNIRHVFTLYHSENNFFGIALYDENLNILAFNAQIKSPKSDSASGYSKYIIGIYAIAEMNIYPASYQFRVHKDTTFMPIGNGLMEIGENKGFINPRDENDRNLDKWYNFSASASNEYTFKLLQTNTFLSIEIFDSKLNFIASDYGTEKELSLTLSGQSRYIIVISGNDTTSYPVNYTVSITENSSFKMIKYAFVIFFASIVILSVIIYRWVKIEK